ncbi:MAG: YciC family protein [Actinomycetota bacterium]
MTTQNPTQGVISEAWGLYTTHAQHLLTVSFVVYAAVAVISAVLALGGGIGLVIGLVIQVIGIYWVVGALVVAVQDVRDGRADLSTSETFKRVRGEVPAIIGLGFLAGFCIGLGLLLFIIPGAILATLWCVAVPVLVLEKAGILDSLGRSMQMVRGWGFQVFGILVIVFLIYLAFVLVLSLILSPVNDSVSAFLSTVIVGTVVPPFMAVVFTLLYWRLRGTGSPATGPPPTA